MNSNTKEHHFLEYVDGDFPWHDPDYVEILAQFFGFSDEKAIVDYIIKHKSSATQKLFNRLLEICYLLPNGPNIPKDQELGSLILSRLEDANDPAFVMIVDAKEKYYRRSVNNITTRLNNVVPFHNTII